MAIQKRKSPRKVALRAASGFKEKKILSHRRHQDGQLLELQHGWAVRFYEDYFDKGERRRRRVQKFLGDFKKLPTKRSAQNVMQEELALVNNFTVRPRSTQTFRERARLWIDDCEKRKNKPVKPSVIRGWKSILRNHVNPVLGETSLSDVRNQAMRHLVQRLAAKGLSPATIKNVMLVVKLTVASATDEDGNALYAVKWNARFIDAPAVDPTKQRRPTFTAKEVEQIVQSTIGRMQAAAVLFAATGLRAGELLGLECRHFDGSAVVVEQEVWRGRVLPPKTPNARRAIDLHPDAAALLKQFIGERTKGFVFQTRSGTPMNQRNLARALYKALEKLGIAKRGFHAFRRFRNTHLRNYHCPDGLLKFWMGHASRDMSDHYDRVREDVQFRRDVARSMGVGFALPKTLTHKRPTASEDAVVGANGRQIKTAMAVSA